MGDIASEIWVDEYLQKIEDYEKEHSPVINSYGDWEVGDFIFNRGMNFYQGNIVKYADRYKRKGGKEDLEKIIDYTKKLIELEYGNETKESGS